MKKKWIPLRIANTMIGLLVGILQTLTMLSDILFIVIGVVLGRYMFNNGSIDFGWYILLAILVFLHTRTYKYRDKLAVVDTMKDYYVIEGSEPDDDNDKN